MFVIRCPWCGDRDMVEFTYGGDATKAYPADPAAAREDDWVDYVYARENPRGPHWEWWHHAHGCRQWVKVRRDTLTHEVLETADPETEDRGSLAPMPGLATARAQLAKTAPKKKAAAKKSSTKKTASKKASATKAPAKKSPSKKAAAKKATAKKGAAKKSTAKKSRSKKAAARRTGDES